MTDREQRMFNDIIELKLRLLKCNVRSGNCPFAVYPTKTKMNIDCNEMSCRDCNDIWAKAKRKEITEQMYEIYGSAEDKESK